MKKYVLLFAGLFLFCSFIQNSSHTSIIPPDNETVSIIFAGDVMGHSPQFEAAYNPQNGTYNYDVCFRQVKSYIENADFSVANLEVPIAGKPYSGYPNFSSPDALLDALTNAGFKILLTANNHVLDRGENGLERTIRQIKKRNLLFEGSYLNENQRDSIYPIILKSKGINIAIFNCTYGTNQNEVSKPNLVNYIDTVEIANDIRDADQQGVDFKIMTVHWGIEYELQANMTQRKIAQFFVNHGINLIVGSHPHVIQNSEILCGKDSTKVPVFYSLGNFISNQRKPNTDGGIMLKVEIGSKSKSILKTSILPVWVYRGILNADYQYYLIPTTEYFQKSAIFNLCKKDSLSLTYFDTETKKRLSNIELLK
jgi:poly-gamma-glutamate capsule biosynthesis protein CapA/YwtB (metallophosphatase superfamily)